jgi:hypothetical protein
MLNLIKQRLKSKTYQAALLGAVLTIIEAQSGYLSSFVPVEYRRYAVMLWPLVMLTLREVTTTALAEK